MEQSSNETLGATLSTFQIVSHGNTSNLLAYLRIHHGNLHAEVTAIMKGGKQQAEPGKRQISRHSHKLWK